MKEKKLFNIKLINILIAFVIGLIIIFPEISRMISDSTSFPMQQRIERSYPLKSEKERRIRPDYPFRPPLGKFINRELSRSDRWHFFTQDFFFFFVLALTLLFFNTRSLLFKKAKGESPQTKEILYSMGGGLLICLLFIIGYSFLHSDRYPQFFPGMEPPFFNGPILFKCLFAWVVAFLLGYILQLFFYQQEIRLENERLKTESLQAQYDMLTAQVNPHFFFNSLNSLAALVREHKQDASLKYINKLSDIFRYVLNSGMRGLVTVNEELEFLKAYQYLLEIRFENKLFFKVNIPESYLNNRLPGLSLQPLIENVIKHNVISEQNPLTVHLFITEDEFLAVANPIQERYVISEEKSGIGLLNLNNRYQLLLSKEIIVEKKDHLFCVKLPLVES